MSAAIIKPTVLLEYFPLKEGWKECHFTLKRGENLSSLGPRCSYCTLAYDSKPLPFAETHFKQCAARATPPDVGPVEMKTEMRSFNHVQEFAIHEGIIWTRLQGETNWKAVYFDGFEYGEVPVAIHADGANLIVLDDKRQVHYKKVLREHRWQDLIAGEKIDANLKSPGPYLAVDKAVRNNWKPAWFTLPVLGPLVNFFNGKRIKIPKNALAFGISHRGAYNDYYEDDAGFKHPTNTGVTTLHILLASGKVIQKLDPWSPPKADMKILIHDTAEATFTGINMDTSGSTLMVIGYESVANSKGGTFKILKVKTRLADIDTDGYNPGIKYTYFKDRANDEVRFISRGTWEEHKLPPEILATGRVTILQTGEGNQARELRVESYMPHEGGAKLGFFYKTLDKTSKWQFKFYQKQKEIKEIIPSQFEVESPFKSVVNHWRVVESSIFFTVPKAIKIELQNFGYYSEASALTFTFKDRVESLLLIRRKNFLSFVGVTDYVYDLINEAADVSKSKLHQLFPIFDRRQQRVQVLVAPEKISIRGLRFSLIFEKIKNSAI